MKILASLIVLVTVTVIYGMTYIEYFNARDNDGHVFLEWQTGQEINLKEFTILRRSVTGDFAPIATIQPKGSNSYYSYYDESTLKTSSSGTVFTYKLQYTDNDGSYATYSQTRTVSLKVSDIKRTWGSIKAMFR